jgi:hypothetical protein
VANAVKERRQMKATARRKHGVKMTMRVYRMNRDGEVTEDHGTVDIEDVKAPVPLNDAYPPCRCSRHRAARETER